MIKTGLLLLAATVALAQPEAKFEVASVKPASSSELDAIKRSGRSSLFPEQGISISGSRVRVLGLATATLVRAAFNLRAAELSGAPNWTANDAYDIDATAETGSALTFPQARQMLQTLLVERFQLKFHREMKEGSTYSLIAAKSGPKLKASAAAEYSTHVTAGKTQVQMTVSRATIAQLCGRLSTFVGRPVADGTNLTGVFDAKLNFAPEGEEGDFPSIFTALQEQLGLKLEPAKASIEVLAIDHLEHPSAN
jgi:uncharacterized protein (TIGR03435 family)